MPVDTRKFDAFIARLEAATKEPAVAEIVTTSEQAGKWHVLEFGARPDNPNWREPRERTVRGRDGRIFSKQAPQGFVFRHARNFVAFLREAIAKRITKGRALARKDLVDAANEAAGRAADLIRKGVPVDTGELRDSIQVKEAK